MASEIFPEDVVLWITPCLFLILFFFGFRNLYTIWNTKRIFTVSLSVKNRFHHSGLLRLASQSPVP